MNLWLLLAVLAPSQDCQQAQTLARRAYEQRRYDSAALQFGSAGAFAAALLDDLPPVPVLRS